MKPLETAGVEPHPPSLPSWHRFDDLGNQPLGNQSVSQSGVKRDEAADAAAGASPLGARAQTIADGVTAAAGAADGRVAGGAKVAGAEVALPSAEGGKREAAELTEPRGVDFNAADLTSSSAASSLDGGDGDGSK